jgi:hypothetical protein
MFLILLMFLILKNLFFKIKKNHRIKLIGEKYIQIFCNFHNIKKYGIFKGKYDLEI